MTETGQQNRVFLSSQGERMELRRIIRKAERRGFALDSELEAMAALREKIASYDEKGYC